MATASDTALVFALKAEPGVLIGVMPRKGCEVAYVESEFKQQTAAPATAPETYAIFEFNFNQSSVRPVTAIYLLEFRGLVPNIWCRPGHGSMTIQSLPGSSNTACHTG
jgi:hypothetical protein